MADNKLKLQNSFEIYTITCTATGKMYVGLTSIGAVKRWKKGHVPAAISRKTDTVLARAIRKYGEKSFTISVIDTAKSFDAAKKKEIRYIAKLGTMAPNGLNATPGGDGLTVCIPETIQKIRDAVVALWATNEYRIKHKEAMKVAVQQPTYKNNRRQAAVEMWEREEYRDKQKESFARTTEKRKVAAIKMWASPEYAAKQYEANNNAKKKEIGRIAALKRWHPEEWETHYGGH